MSTIGVVLETKCVVSNSQRRLVYFSLAGVTDVDKCKKSKAVLAVNIAAKDVLPTLQC